MCRCQGFLGCEILTPEVVNFHLKSLLETTSAQSKQICSFDDGDTHTRSIDLVGVESTHSAIEVEDSQMKPETLNASHTTRHFWLAKRSTCSKSILEGEHSHSVPVTSGGPQGSVPGSYFYK